MCGIGGAFAFDGRGRIDAARLSAAAAAMSHRGPDGEGIWTSPDGAVGLLHRRLSVIDVALGRQPLADASEGLVIVFNGEVYNYRELRQELEAKGHRFRTNSDTEVILESYRAKGPACLDDFRGMFAFAIWDRDRRKLFLARDRVGKKPLFTTVHDGTFYFASTLDALRALCPTTRTLDTEAIDDFLSLAYIPAPRTAWVGIAKLPAASKIEVDAAGARQARYWSLDDPRPSFQGTEAQAIDAIDELIQDAVRLRLRSDVPLGVFLSGGIDSSLVTAVAARQSKTIETFSIGFDVPEFDESGYAAAIAEHLGTQHRTFQARLDILDLMPQVVRQYGEPFGDSSSINVWQLSEFTRRHVTVALGGDGGDEGFYGYEWYRRALQIAEMRRRVPPAMARAAGRAMELPGFASATMEKARRALTLLGSSQSQQFGIQRTFINGDDVKSLYRGALAQTRHSRAETAAHWLARLYMDSHGSDLNRMRNVDIQSYLADCLMPKVDVASMAHGLEARAPLLDHRILELAASLPDAWSTNTTTGKLPLRTVLARYVPRHLFERRKAGFSLPLKTWFATSTRPRLERLAERSAIMDLGWFHADGIKRMIAEHARGTRDHTARLYNLLVLEEWVKANT